MQRFEEHRRSSEVGDTRLSYIDVGQGPATLFVHGVFFNALIWGPVIGELAAERRCLAIDLPAHGDSPASPGQDLSLPAAADLLDAFLEKLGLAQVDLVGNDTGGALCQVFAVRHPDRVRTLTLTNCDAHDNLPPELFQPAVDLAQSGQLAGVIQQLAADPAAARSLPGSIGDAFADADALSDEEVLAFLGPFADSGRAEAIERFVVSQRTEDLLAIEDDLARMSTPTLIVWGTADPFFELDWAHWLADHIPGATKVVEAPGGALCFFYERPDDLVPHLRDFLDEHVGGAAEPVEQ